MNTNNSVKQNRGPTSKLWIGLALIVSGAVILLNQMNVLSFEFNWWAIFSLFPAFGALSGAYKRYRYTHDLFEMDVLIPALVGIFILLLSVSLFLGDAINMNLKVYWPILLIILGLGLILGRGRRYNSE